MLMGASVARPAPARAVASEVSLETITKRFGAVIANDQVSLDIRPGEAHALLGENGAGKTTLMKILYGLYRPDGGRILVDGRPVTIRSPQDALSLGIGMIHQHFMLVPNMTVAENFAIGQAALWRRWSARRIEQRVRDWSAAAGLPIDPRAYISDLSVGAQQRVEIVRALSRGARVLILDEPTAVLTPQEANELIDALRGMVAGGKSVVFISHKLPEVMDVSDRVSVLRGGRLVQTVDTKATNERELATMMIGRGQATLPRRSRKVQGQVALVVRDLHVTNDRAQSAVQGLSFDLHRGEILGVAGVDGNGQAELGQALAGLRAIRGGSVRLGERQLAGRTPAQIIKAGVGFVSEDRQVWGLFPDLSVAENLISERHTWPAFSRAGVLKRTAIVATAAALIRDYDIRPPDPNLAVGSMSGGNKQKVVIARTFARRPDVIVISQPTRGVDIGASEYIRGRLLDECAGGAAVLLISADLDEILALSDRIAVMYEGRFTTILQREQATLDRIGLLMAGIVPAGQAA